MDNTVTVYSDYESPRPGVYRVYLVNGETFGDSRKVIARQEWALIEPEENIVDLELGYYRKEISLQEIADLLPKQEWVCLAELHAGPAARRLGILVSLILSEKKPGSVRRANWGIVARMEIFASEANTAIFCADDYVAPTRENVEAFQKAILEAWAQLVRTKR